MTTPDGHVSTVSNGRRAVTRNPPVGAGPATTSPPWTAARSRMPIRPPPNDGDAVPCPSSHTSTISAVGVAHQHDGCVGRAGMLDHVRGGLLDDAVGGETDPGGDR